MQARKRAKPVKFGRQSTVQSDEKIETGEVEKSYTNSKQGPVQIPAPAGVSENEAATTQLSDKLSDVPFLVDSSVPPPAAKAGPPVPVVAGKNDTDAGDFMVAESKDPTVLPSPQAPSLPETNTQANISSPALTEPFVSQIGAAEPPLPDQPVPEGTDPFNNPKVLSGNSAGRKGFLIPFILIILVAFLVGLAFIAGGYYALNSHALSGFSNISKINVFSFLQKQEPTLAPKPVLSSPSLTPTSAASQSANLSAFSIQVLNGSGITGLAAKVKTQLETAGFTVSSIGNASTSNNTQTIIAAKSTVPQAYLDQLKTQLAQQYHLGPVTSIPAGTASQADVIVTIGTPSGP